MKNSANVPMRRCVACRESKPKCQLIRFVRVDDHAILDKSYNADGRGFYICPSSDCIAKARKRKFIDEELAEEVKRYAEEIR